MAARLAAERATDADLDRLRQFLRDAEVAVAHKDDDAIARTNSDFHTELVEVAENTFLSMLMRPLATRLRWQFRLAQDLDLSIPCGFSLATPTASGGLPIGLQIVGKPFDEPTVFAVADAYQHVTDWHLRRAPYALSEVEVG